jgi:alpha-methylacyl-CoA racemase
MAGSLEGIRVVEMASIGPVPFAGMLLSDMGADVVRIDRPPHAGPAPFLTPIDRGRRSVTVDLKHSDGAGVVLDLVSRADILIEGLRPGVMERLGLGPDACQARNQRLVYGRMTGFGRSGEWSKRAGHDINYVAMTGALDMIGQADGPPLPPLNLVGDFGGGGMLLAFGVMCALHSARASGRGQVVDTAMIDGVNLLMAMHLGLRAEGLVGPRGTNGLDGGSPYYCAYETADGKWMAVGAIEEPFYVALLTTLGLDPRTVPDRVDRSQWPALRERLTQAFRTRTQDEWCRVFQDVDACVSPVLGPDEVEKHHHHVERKAFQEVGGVVQPTPAPRFGDTPGRIQGPPPAPGEHTEQALGDWGFEVHSIARLTRAGVIGQRHPEAEQTR